MFDNGRLKTANFNTDQGFGLRAVAGEATGYAHSSELVGSRAAARLGRRLDGQGRLFRNACRRARPHQQASLRRRQSDRRAVVRREGEAAAGNRRLAARPRPARAPGDGLARRLVAACRDPACRRPGGARHPPAGARQLLRRGRRRRAPGKRLVRHGRAQVVRGIPGRGQLAVRRGGSAAPGAGQPRGDPRPGRHVRHRAVQRLAGHHAARGGRPRAGRRLQPQEDLGLRRADGQAGRLQGRHRGRRRHHRRAARLAHRRRRGDADQPHRADR